MSLKNNMIIDDDQISRAAILLIPGKKAIRNNLIVSSQYFID